MKFKKNIFSFFLILIMLTSMSLPVFGSPTPAILVGGDKAGGDSDDVLADIPINDAYSKENLGDIFVSKSTLRSFSRDLSEDEEEFARMNYSYIDEDLLFECAWVFASPIDIKKVFYETLENSSSNESNDMLQYLKDFDRKYPTKYVKTGHVTFITVENKDVLLSEISDEDIQMFRKISETILKEREGQIDYSKKDDYSRYQANYTSYDGRLVAETISCPAPTSPPLLSNSCPASPPPPSPKIIDLIKNLFSFWR